MILAPLVRVLCAQHTHTPQKYHEIRLQLMRSTNCCVVLTLCSRTNEYVLAHQFHWQFFKCHNCAVAVMLRLNPEWKMRSIGTLFRCVFFFWFDGKAMKTFLFGFVPNTSHIVAATLKISSNWWKVLNYEDLMNNNKCFGTVYDAYYVRWVCLCVVFIWLRHLKWIINASA